MIYSGINATKQLTDAYDQGATRESLRQEDAARKRAGGQIAGGNLTGASAELFGVGDLQGGMQMRETARAEGREASTRSIMSEFARGAAGPMPSTSTQNLPSTSTQNRASSALSGPDYSAGAVTSEALPAMGAEPATGRASADLGANLPVDSKAAFDMRRMTGGDLSASALFSKASELWASGDIETAKAMWTDAVERQGIESDLDFKNEGAVALHFVEEYGRMSREERGAFAEEVRTNRQMLASAPKDVLEALLDGNPDNDDEAMRRWARSYGVDPSAVDRREDADNAYELDEGRRRSESRYDRAGEIEDYRTKAEIDASYEQGGENYRGDVSGNETFPPPENRYGVAPVGVFGQDGSMWSPGLANQPAGVQGAYVRHHLDQMSEIEAEHRGDQQKMKVTMSYVQKIEEKGLFDKLGSGPSARIQRILTPTEFEALNTNVQQLVRAERMTTRGIFTDYDAAMAEKLGVNSRLSGEDILAMMKAQIVVAGRADEQLDFFEEYTTNIGGVGSINQAKSIWREYERQNPVLAFDGERVIRNEGSLSFSEWYPAWEYAQQAERATPEDRAAAAGYD